MKVWIFVAYILAQSLIGSCNAAEDDIIPVDYNTKKEFEIGDNNMDTAMKDKVMSIIHNAYSSSGSAYGRTSYIGEMMTSSYSKYKWVVIKDPDTQWFGTFVTKYMWIKKDEGWFKKATYLILGITC